MFRMVQPPITRSAKNCIYSTWYLSHRYCYLPLSWNIIYIRQDATLHSLFYLETALYVSDGTTTHHQQRKQLYLQHLVFVTPLLLYAAIVEELELVWVCCGWRTAVTAWQIQDAVDTVVCAPDDGWRFHPKTCRAVSRYNTLCNVASCWKYILE